jgi:hypothetical protein
MLPVELLNCYVGNDNGDPRVLGFPAGSLPRLRFLSSGAYQAYDQTRFFGMEGDAKTFLPGVFPVRQGTGEAAPQA